MNVSVNIKNQISIDAEKAEKLSAKLGLNRKLTELLILRGIDSEEAMRKFLYPDKAMFHDPLSMKGMNDAVERIQQAVKDKETVVIYGDYDADGVCAAAILALFLSVRGLEVYVHIPNRVGDGYGLNNDSLEKIISAHMPDLIITCDCGISGAEEVRFALELGVDMIITDHHEVSGEIPECIVVNPKQEDCGYPFSMLCGAGVALKLVEALSSRDEMLEYTDLACVATIADLVPLSDENRLIVQFGLERINKRKNLGLAMLFDELGMDTVTSGDIAYKAAPRINAAGRMGDAYRAFELLTVTDVGRIKSIIDEITEDNARRKEMCDEMYSEAVGDIAFENLTDNRAIVLSHPSWEKGITGILAARLAGEYNRPVFIMVKSGDDAFKGTCRSIDGINIHELLVRCKDVLLEFGGHSQAAGFSIRPDRIDDFKAAVNEYLSSYPDEYFTPKAVYDMEILPQDVKYDFVKSLELLEPTGNGNLRPLFKMEIEDMKVAACKNNQSHMSMILDSGFQIFAFNYSRLSYQLLSPGKKTIVAELQTSNYGGRQIKGIMRCCAPSELYINDSICDGFEYGLLKFLPKDKCEYSLYSPEDLNELTRDFYGTLVIAPDRKSYEEYSEKFDKPAFREFIYTTSRNNFSRVIVAPSLTDGNLCLSNYRRIIFLRAPLNNGVIAYLNSVTKAEILLPDEAENKYDVSADRAVFAAYFECMKAAGNIQSASLNGYFRALNKLNPSLNLHQFMFCIQVFEELKFIKIAENPFSVSFNKGIRADLNTSQIYSFVKEKLKA